MSALLQFANRLRSLKGLEKEVAKEAVPDVLAASQATASAGTTPSGESWAPKKRGEGKPLANAAAKIECEALGDVIQLRVGAPELYHSLGIGNPKRTIIPDTGDDIPEGVAKALAAAAERVFHRKVGT